MNNKYLADAYNNLDRSKSVSYYTQSINYDNYIIAHHIFRTDDNGNRLKKLYRIPMYPQEVSDSLNSNYVETRVLARSAPYQSWIGSGPRNFNFNLQVHRDLDFMVTGNGGIEKVGDINELIDEYQALCLPNYDDPMKVIAPKITIKIGNGLRVTGIPQINYTNMLPIDRNGIYQRGNFTITVTEINAYDATNVSTTIHNARGYGKDEYGANL